VSNHRLSLAHRIVTSTLISRCQTILSLSHTHTHNCHPDAYFELSNHCLSFPEVVTSMLTSRCRTIVSLSLSLRDRDLDFLPAHWNKQSAGNANALCVAVAPWSLSALVCVTRWIRKKKFLNFSEFWMLVVDILNSGPWDSGLNSLPSEIIWEKKGLNSR
jgi:hypothetical protein